LASRFELHDADCDEPNRVFVGVLRHRGAPEGRRGTGNHRGDEGDRSARHCSVDAQDYSSECVSDAHIRGGKSQQLIRDRATALV
jgi:hypothetical protein